MGDALLAAYVDAFLSRCRQSVAPGSTVVGDGGLCGTLPTAEDGSVRLLVLDDRGLDALPQSPASSAFAGSE